MSPNPDNRATEGDLGELHGLVARYLSEKIASGECTVAEINAAIKLLKDNGIDCVGKVNPDINNLAEGLPTYEDTDGVDLLH